MLETGGLDEETTDDGIWLETEFWLDDDSNSELSSFELVLPWDDVNLLLSVVWEGGAGEGAFEDNVLLGTGGDRRESDW